MRAEGRVVLAKEYRELADECLGWAKTARADKERRIFLQMAETWLRAARLAEERGRRLAVAGNRKAPPDGVKAPSPR
jgi:hypothetical protein